MKIVKLDNFKIGYFIVYRSRNSWYDKAIEKYQIKDGYSKEDARYTHVEISLGGPHSINAVFPRIKVSDIREKRDGRYVKIVRHKMPDYRDKRKNVAMECAKKIGNPYGLGVVWFIMKDAIKRNVFSAIGDFCSELCGFGLYNYYVNHRKKPMHEVLSKKHTQLYPCDFLDPKYFEVITEGYIIADKEE